MTRPQTVAQQATGNDIRRSTTEIAKQSDGFHWSATDTGPISRVLEGMRVVDRTGQDLGSVELVRMGNLNATTAGVDGHRSNGFLNDLARAFGATDGLDVPDAIGEQLHRVGYLKVDGKGFLDSDLFVAADTIADVRHDHVHLTVDKSQLIQEGS